MLTSQCQKSILLVGQSYSLERGTLCSMLAARMPHTANQWPVQFLRRRELSTATKPTSETLYCALTTKHSNTSRYYTSGYNCMSTHWFLGDDRQLSLANPALNKLASSIPAKQCTKSHYRTTISITIEENSKEVSD